MHAMKNTLARVSPYRILSDPTLYHYVRQTFTGGMPFSRFITMYGLDDPNQRVADLGCGPADILRYLGRGREPSYYLGVDISDSYLQAARKRAEAAGIRAEFLNLDLTQLTDSSEVQDSLVRLLEEKRITRVLLLGVLHHIPDAAVDVTLHVVHRASCVQTLVTQDVVLIDGHPLNNFLCRLDRGEHVRDERKYDALASRSPWGHYTKAWSRTGVQFIKYIHFTFSRSRLPQSCRVGTAHQSGIRN
jgi:SAM-dependent methyltransferase